MEKILKKKTTEEEMVKIKEFWLNKYSYVKETYRYYASANPIGDIWAI